MRVSNSSNKWIEAGYTLFAESGPDAIQIEKMARMLKTNKSGFYYFFGDKEIFFDELAKYHNQIGIKFANEIKAIKNFDPEYIDLLMKYRNPLFVQMQMRKHGEIKVFGDTFEMIRKRNDLLQLAVWSEFLGLPNQQILAAELFDIARDMIYTRLSPENVTKDSLTGLFELIRKVVQKIAKPQAP